ncbi:hypothetical protein ACJJTC_006128, partial [Scirpophaga incertulas]
MRRHDTIGVDLVAMCVNDILCNGATPLTFPGLLRVRRARRERGPRRGLRRGRGLPAGGRRAHRSVPRADDNDILCNGATPLTFLDYFACGALDVSVARDVVSGVAEGCRQAGAALIGQSPAQTTTTSCATAPRRSPSWTTSRAARSTSVPRADDNDILCNGATPLTFLDYFACGALDVSVARDVVSGVAEGCRQAGAALIGQSPPRRRQRHPVQRRHAAHLPGLLRVRRARRERGPRRGLRRGRGLPAGGRRAHRSVPRADDNDILCNGATPLTFLDYFACGALDVSVARDVVSGVAEGCRQAGAALIDDNDILCNGATPLTFLDYFACGALDVSVARDVVSGVAEGCRQAGAALIGGETAEMPGVYGAGVYDLAGFALGAVERARVLPRISDITVGDIIIGLPSNGVHSNGFSLIHNLMNKAGLSLQDKAPFSREGLTLGEELIKPTRIYANAILPALRTGHVKAVAHITGGGLLDNIPRVIPPTVRARLDAHCWHLHPVFAWIADTGAVSDEEMVRTFNCGLGMIMVVAPEDQAEIMNATRAFGAMVVGSVQARAPGGARVLVDNLASALDLTRRM